MIYECVSCGLNRKLATASACKFQHSNSAGYRVQLRSCPCDPTTSFGRVHHWRLSIRPTAQTETSMRDGPAVLHARLRNRNAVSSLPTGSDLLQPEFAGVRRAYAVRQSPYGKFVPRRTMIVSILA
jgi:hypothetical protein